MGKIWHLHSSGIRIFGPKYHSDTTAAQRALETNKENAISLDQRIILYSYNRVLATKEELDLCLSGMLYMNCQL